MVNTKPLKDCVIYKELEKRHSSAIRKEEIKTKPQLYVKLARIQSKTIRSSQASVTRIENSQSITCQIYRAFLFRNKLVYRKFMQKLQNAMKELPDIMCQLMNDNRYHQTDTMTRKLKLAIAT